MTAVFVLHDRQCDRCSGMYKTTGFAAFRISGLIVYLCEGCRDEGAKVMKEFLSSGK